MSRVGVLDLASGISGDMFLGALLDAGASFEAARRAVEAATGGRASLRVDAVHRGSLRATRAVVLVDGAEVRESGGPLESGERGVRAVAGQVHGHGHEHEHEHEHGREHGHEHEHTAASDVLRRIRESDLPASVSAGAARIYELLAAAEGRVHGVEPSAVHFHEVGSLDAVADVVGTVAALDSLGLDWIAHGPVALGGGTVDTDHGRLAVPAPATLELLEGRPCTLEPGAGELTTPTGAALVAGLAHPLPVEWTFRPERVGYGAGARNPRHRPNVARLVLGTVEASSIATTRVAVIEASLDDMTPEDAGFLLERLLEAGALDATLSPLIMKKSRPGFLIRVLARPDEGPEFAERLVGGSTSLGARWRIEERRELPRRVETVQLADGAVRIKVATLPDGRERIHAEYEDLAALARARNVPIRMVRDEVERAWTAGR